MGFRFRKSVGVLPGVKLNFGKGLPSLSIGGQGVTTNIGAKGARTTVGVPGSGLSYSSYVAHGKGKVLPVLVMILLAGVLFLLRNY